MLLVAVILAVSPAMNFESLAIAGFLKNGVSPRSGDRLQTLRPPPPGSRDRIKAPGEPRPTTAAVRARRQTHAWFWQIHEPDAPANPARWSEALSSIRTRRAAGNAVFDAASLQTIRRAYGPEITLAAARHGLSEPFLIAVIAVESRGKLKAVSPKGARGLMQLIPATARRFGVTDPFDAGQNIGGGASYLDWLLNEFSEDPILALAGYNAGEGAVRKHGGVPPYSETRDYVVKVLDALAALDGFCTSGLLSPRSKCNWLEGS